MTDIYVVDTHTLSWYLAGNEKLGAVAKKALHDSAVRIVVPTLVLGELVSMIERGKTAIGPADGVVDAIVGDPRVTLDNLDLEIVRIAASLGGELELHDRLIVASTVRIARGGQSVALLTVDDRITKSGLVPVVW